MTLITFLFCAMCIMPGVPRRYHFVDLALSWAEAQQYCRVQYSDLATVGSVEDVQELRRPSSYTGLAWIGLMDDPASWIRNMTSDSNSWRWSTTDTTSPGAFQIWAQAEPNFLDADQPCVAYFHGKWIDYFCTTKYGFICYSGSKEKQFVINWNASTWYDAQTFCRSHYKDLAMIESAAEHKEVLSLKDRNSHAWIGLYREPWRWSDNSVSHFTNWGQGQPDNRRNMEHCAAENSAHAWSDEDCTVKLPFICQQESKLSHNVKMMFLADIDLSDPEVNKQILQLVRKKLGLTNVQWKIKPKKK